MLNRMESIWRAGLPYLVAELEGQVRGYAYPSPWKERRGYRFSVEATVYMATDSHRRGCGSALYRNLCPQLSALGLHSVFAGIALPNEVRVRLHESFGMVQVAHLREVGLKFGE